MRHILRQFKILFALLLAISLQAKIASEDSVTVQTPTSDYDVAVIGGTPAGIAAAIAAGRAGKTVILIEQSPVLGGVLSSGVIRLDDLYVGHPEKVGELASRVMRLESHSRACMTMICVQNASVAG